MNLGSAGFTWDARLGRRGPRPATSCGCGEGAARALDTVLRGADLHLVDGPAPDTEGFREHVHDGPLGFLSRGLVVEFHDDAVLGGIGRPRPAHGRRHHFARDLARHGGVSGGHEGAGAKPRQVHDGRLGRQNARDLDEVDVADTRSQERVVESVERSRSLSASGGCRGLGHRFPAHSLLALLAHRVHGTTASREPSDTFSRLMLASRERNAREKWLPEAFPEAPRALGKGARRAPSRPAAGDLAAASRRERPFFPCNAKNMALHSKNLHSQIFASD